MSGDVARSFQQDLLNGLGHLYYIFWVAMGCVYTRIGSTLNLFNNGDTSFSICWCSLDTAYRHDNDEFLFLHFTY